MALDRAQDITLQILDPQKRLSHDCAEKRRRRFVVAGPLFLKTVEASSDGRAENSAQDETHQQSEHK